MMSAKQLLERNKVFAIQVSLSPIYHHLQANNVFNEGDF